MNKKMRRCTPVFFWGIMALLMLLAACTSTPKTTDGSEAQEKNNEEIQLSRHLNCEIQALKKERKFIDSKIVKLTSENVIIAQNVSTHNARKQELEKDLSLNIRARMQKVSPIISENIAICIECHKLINCYKPITNSANKKSSILRAFERISKLVKIAFSSGK